MSHTKGPWRVYEVVAAVSGVRFPSGVPVEIGTVAGNGARTGTICELIGQGDGKYDPDVTAANARLIAAAPDLLDALKAMVADFEHVARNSYTRVATGEFLESDVEEAEPRGYAVWKQAKTAIAKAEGVK